MAYLNSSERADLQRELERLSFRRANGRLKRMDPLGRIACWRNAQRTGQWETRHMLVGLGTQVILIERNTPRATKRADRIRNDYTLASVRVEPTPDNRN